jgi:UDP:flavonoid glycosyltransferase YjiC (YdhE family)
MNVTVLASGSMGDVMPAMRIAGGLADAGHRVRVMCNPQYEQLATRSGVAEFRGYWIDHETMVRQQRKINNVYETTFDKAVFESLLASYPDILDGCRDADVVCAHFFGLKFARALGIPFFELTNILPFFRWSKATLPHVESWTPIGGLHRLHVAARHVPQGTAAVNRLTHLLGKGVSLVPSPRAVWRQRGAVREWLETRPARQRAMSILEQAAAASNRSVRQEHFVETLVGVSKHVIPPPSKSFPGILTGFWFSTSQGLWKRPESLSRFLEEGETPIYVGFGSMPCTARGRGFDWLSRIVAQAISMTGCRAVIYRGWGGLSLSPHLGKHSHRVIEVDEVPFEWLFPRVSLVVHHGGSGTTQDVLRHGLPSVVVPFVQDQFFWSWRLYDLGVAPAPIKADRLSAHRLANAIQDARSDPRMRQRAASLGELLRSEDGVRNAVVEIEKTMRARARAS